MFKSKKIIFALILSFILTTAGSTAEITPVLATDNRPGFDFDDFFYDFFDGFEKNPNGKKLQDNYVKDKNGLTGEYYSNMDFKGQKTTRVDPRISFDWGTGSPTWSMNADKFSIRWTGQIEPKYSELYTFHTITDDGVRLWINGQLIIDQWKNRAATEYTGTIRLSANKRYNIKMEYYDNKDDACAKLLWSSKSQEKEIIPKNRLFPSTGNVRPTSTPVPKPTPTPIATPSTAPITADLTEYFDQDAFSYDSDRRDGDYDGSGNTYPADLAERNSKYGSIPFKLGSFENDRNNSIICDRQVISLEKGRYAAIYLAGSSTNGNKSGVFKINYTDGTYSSVTVSMKDWCTSDTSGQSVLQSMSHRHSYSGNNGTICRIFVYTLPADTGKTVKSITLPAEKDMHILAITLAPHVNSSPVSVKGNGLLAQYFDDMDLTDPVLSRIDPTVNFNWETGSPESNIGPNTFSVRWTGQIMPQYSETYTFTTVSDDGVRLWVNNKLLIDDWTEQAATENSGSIALTAGQKYNIRLEYFDKTDKAIIRLYWSSPSRSREIVPEARLFN